MSESTELKEPNVSTELKKPNVKASDLNWAELSQSSDEEEDSELPSDDEKKFNEESSVSTNSMSDEQPYAGHSAKESQSSMAFQNPYAVQHRCAFQNPYACHSAQNPPAVQHRRAFQNPYAGHSVQNPRAFQGPNAFQNPRAFQQFQRPSAGHPAQEGRLPGNANARQNPPLTPYEVRYNEALNEMHLSNGTPDYNKYVGLFRKAREEWLGTADTDQRAKHAKEIYEQMKKPSTKCAASATHVPTGAPTTETSAKQKPKKGIWGTWVARFRHNSRVKYDWYRKRYGLTALVSFAMAVVAILVAILFLTLRQ